MGGNQEAARLSGIPVERYRTLAYFLSALLAAIGGVMLGARIGSSQINAGAGFLMPAVAAAFIGYSVAGVKKTKRHRHIDWRCSGRYSGK